MPVANKRPLASQARLRDQDDTSMALQDSQQTQRRRITRRQDGTENDRPNVILDTFADLEDEDLCGHAQPQDDDAPLNLNITGVEPSRLARTPAARTPAFRTPASGDLGFNSLASTNAALLEKMSEQDDKLSGILKCLERIEAIFMKNGKGKGDEDEKKLSKADMDRMKTIALTVMEVDVYASKEPGGAIVSALLKHIGATNITTGRRQLGYEKFNLMMDAIDAFLRSKLRADASRALKEAVPRFYGLAFDNDGKLDHAKADALIPKIAHIQGNFDNSRFADLLKDTFPKPLDAPAAPPRVGRGGAGPPITWLGPGQVAFALALVQWVLRGHLNLPQPNNKADWHVWKQLYDEALDSIAEMPKDCGILVFKHKG